MSDRPRIIPFRYSSLSLAYTICASIVFLFAPIAPPASGSPHDPPISLLEANGWKMAIVFALPIVFAVVPVVRRRSPHVRTLMTASAVLLVTYVLLGVLSIGIYYAPSAILMIAAAFRERPAPREPAAGYRGEPTVPPAPPPPSLNGQR